MWGREIRDQRLVSSPTRREDSRCRLEAVVFDDALRELYRAPHSEFTATRKRLCALLSEEGDVTGAARLAKLSRPPLSAWVVNQLWWRARPTFEALIRTAGKLRDGDSKAGGGYRDAMTKLRGHATTVLGEAGHQGGETTLRRITTTLAAIAAVGWTPEEPGMLSSDREPPGVEQGDVTVSTRTTRAQPSEFEESPPTVVSKPTFTQPPPPPRPRVVANGRVHPHVEMHTEHEQRTSVVTTRSLLETALRTAKQQIEASEVERMQLQRRLAEVEHAIAQARTIVTDVEARLGSEE